jgi:hypothetical protein
MKKYCRCRQHQRPREPSKQQCGTHLDHKPRNRVRILLARQYAERISDNFHRGTYDDRAEVPGAMAQEQEKMSRERDSEDRDAEDADGERRCISIELVNILS